MRGLWVILAVTVVSALGAREGYRFSGFNNCSADGSAVWLEKANSQGNYEGLGNGPENCK